MPIFLNCEISKRHTTSFYLAVNLILLPMHSSVSLFSVSIMSYVHNPCVFYEVAIRLEVCVLPLQGWPTSQKPRATFLTVLQQRAISYTWTHMKNITPSLPYPHTYLHSQIYCKYHTPPTRQWQNFTRHLLLYMVFSGTSGI